MNAFVSRNTILSLFYDFFFFFFFFFNFVLLHFLYRLPKAENLRKNAVETNLFDEWFVRQINLQNLRSVCGKIPKAERFEKPSTTAG